jgi:hypothetical protein
MNITKSELEALEILVKAGKVAANMEWLGAIGEAGNVIVNLADRIKQERISYVAGGIIPSELEALELLTKAGRVATNVEWITVISEAGDAILSLSDTIMGDRQGQVLKSLPGAAVLD